MQAQITTELKTAQTEYLTAKAKKDFLQQQTDILNLPLYEMVDAGKISDEEWATKVTDNEYKTGLSQARDKLFDAENKLMTAAKAVVYKKATPKQWAEMKAVWECNWSSIREKVITLSLQLSED